MSQGLMVRVAACVGNTVVTNCSNCCVAPFLFLTTGYLYNGFEMDPNDITQNYNTLVKDAREYEQRRQIYLRVEADNLHKDTNVQWERDLRDFIDREKNILTVGGVVVAVMIVATVMLLPRMKLNK